MPIKKYHLGTTVWGLKEWKGDFFTDEASPSDFLGEYASVFNTVEGNTTFYGSPKPETVAKWADAVPDGFNFCFKFPQMITHHKSLKGTDGDVEKFLDLLRPLRLHLGPFLIQLPASFSPERFHDLERFLESLPPDFSYGLEVRHPDFFGHDRSEKRLDALLKTYGINRVVFDTRKLFATKLDDPSIREAQGKKPQVPVRFDLVGSHPMVRYVGVNDPMNNETYLKEWAIIVAEWIKEGKHPYFFVHTPDQYYGPWAARFFHRMLARLMPSVGELPEFPAERPSSEQLDLF